MNIDNASLLVGIIFSIVIIVIRAYKQKLKFFEKTNLFILLGYILVSFTTALLFVKTLTFAILTYKNELTLEIIQQNKFYMTIAWGILSLGAVITFISLILENKKLDSSSHHPNNPSES